MSNLGVRLKEERMRLGLSQSAFAELLGIHRNTQIKYESGAREPDSSYLDAITRLGVNTQYVMGLHDIKPDDLLRMALDDKRSHMPGDGVHAILDALDISHEAWDEIISSLVTISPTHGVPFSVTCDPIWGEKIANASSVIRGFIDKAAALDSSLLAGILEGVDMALSAQGKSLSSAKKAQAVAMLYRAFKASGEVDRAMIDEAVKLATE